MKRLAGLSVAAFLAALSAGSPAQETETVKLSWQSQNRSKAELSREFAKLYAGLLKQYEAGNRVPTVAVRVPEGKPIGAVLRERGLFDGAFEPRELELFVCKLNRSCRIHRGPSRQRDGDDAIVTWRLLPNDEIIVPDIRFEPVVLHRPYQKKRGDTLRSIVVNDRGGCATFDHACETYVHNLNRRLGTKLDDWYEGEIVVPTKAYRAEIPIIRPVQAKPAAELWQASGTTGSGARPVLAVDPQPAPAPAPPAEVQFERAVRDSRARREVLEQSPTLQRQVAPPPRVILHSNGAALEPMASNRDRILKLIRLPRPLPARGLVSHIAVFDNAIDDAHCLLGTVTVVDRAPSPRTLSKCGEWGAAAKATDHGTHVVGLIAAINDPRLGQGINPGAVVTFVQINPDDFVNRDYLIRQSDILRKLYETRDPPDVVNLSFEYSLPEAQGQFDPFGDEMEAQGRNTLFVVSAGNASRALQSSGNCTVRPACYGRPNVLTVAALNLDERSPDIAAGSNYGDRVHIGAPGVDVVSTIANNRIGAMSGTSQAAPVVSGAASLFYAYDSRLAPGKVKNRLIYTADIFPGLQDKVFGGRLNIERALKYQKAVVETKDAQRIEGVPARPTSLVYFSVFPGGAKLDVKFGQIKRLVFDADLDRYTLFYLEESATDSAQLLRALVTVRANRTYSFAVPAAAAGGPERNVSVELKNIQDYIAALSI